MLLSLSLGCSSVESRTTAWPDNDHVVRFLLTQSDEGAVEIIGPITNGVRRAEIPSRASLYYVGFTEGDLAALFPELDADRLDQVDLIARAESCVSGNLLSDDRMVLPLPDTIDVLKYVEATGVFEVPNAASLQLSIELPRRARECVVDRDLQPFAQTPRWNLTDYVGWASGWVHMAVVVDEERLLLVGPEVMLLAYRDQVVGPPAPPDHIITAPTAIEHGGWISARVYPDAATGERRVVAVGVAEEEARAGFLADLTVDGDGLHLTRVERTSSPLFDVVIESSGRAIAAGNGLIAVYDGDGTFREITRPPAERYRKINVTTDPATPHLLGDADGGLYFGGVDETLFSEPLSDGTVPLQSEIMRLALSSDPREVYVSTRSRSSYVGWPGVNFSRVRLVGDSRLASCTTLPPDTCGRFELSELSAAQPLGDGEHVLFYADRCTVPFVLGLTSGCVSQLVRPDELPRRDESESMRNITRIENKIILTTLHSVYEWTFEAASDAR